MWTYQTRLLKDIARWQAIGIVDAPTAAALQADTQQNSRRYNITGVLAVLGAILIGFGTMSFVAANWQILPRLVRLAMLFSGLWAAYIATGYFKQRQQEMFANAASLIGVSIFGASIMLISQMFHIEGNPPDAVLLWAAGSLLTGVVLSSTAALGLTMPLLMLWGGWEQAQVSTPYWFYLVPWALMTLGFVWQRWNPGLHLSAIALMAFVVSLGFTLRETESHGVVAIIGLVVTVIAWIARSALPNAWLDDIYAVVGYGLVTTFVGLFALQFFNDPPLEYLVVFAGSALLLVISAIFAGFSLDRRALLWLGYCGFSIEILALYFKTVGSLLGSSLFFIISGVVVSVLAIVAYKIHQRFDHGGA